MSATWPATCGAEKLVPALPQSVLVSLVRHWSSPTATTSGFCSSVAKSGFWKRENDEIESLLQLPSLPSLIAPTVMASNATPGAETCRSRDAQPRVLPELIVNVCPKFIVAEST